MKHLTIKKIGPLSVANLCLSNINLIIGPQSSGKSCILKIASFCAWAEKRIELNQNETVILNKEAMYKHLILFHNLQGYINDDSYFEYETDTMFFSFLFKDNTSKFKWKEGRWHFKRAKIAYIVAERNVLSVIPNWYEMDLPKNSLRHFLKEWQNVRNSMNGKGKMRILNIGAYYGFDSQKQSDTIQIINGKELSLQSASSGLQSLIPLYVIINYMCEFFFRTNMESIRDHDLNMKLLNSMKASHPLRDRIYIDKDGMDFVGFELSETLNNFRFYQYSDIYLEEPEENLFPETQHHLVNWLADLTNGKRKHSLFITTHSPYIMSAFNNLIQAGDILEESPEKEAEVRRIIGGCRAIKYDDVAAFAIENGTVHSIKDDELRLISPSELDTASDKISSIFNQLLQL